MRGVTRVDRRAVLDLFRLDGRVAVVTGASSGLGAVVARQLAEAGADVVVAARRGDRLADARGQVEAIGRRALAVPVDVTDPAACRRLVDLAVAKLGSVDVLVNNAGVGSTVPAIREPPEEFRHVVDVNLLGCYWMAQACAQAMDRGSSIVNVSSILGLTSAGQPIAAYAASKAGLLGLTRDLAQQWGARKGIRVNAVAPGFFRSEMTAANKAGYLEAQGARTWLGRLPALEEIGAAIVFLAGDAAGYVTGETLVVDGGFLIS